MKTQKYNLKKQVLNWKSFNVDQISKLEEHFKKYILGRIL